MSTLASAPIADPVMTSAPERAPGASEGFMIGSEQEPADTTRHGSHWPISILSTLAALVNMLLPLVLVRILSPAEIGAFKIFFLYLMIAPSFALTSGLINGLSYWSGRAERREAAIQSSSVLVLATALLVLGALGVFHRQLSAYLGWSGLEGAIFAAATLGAIASPFFEEAAIATGRIWTGAIFGSGLDFSRTLAILVTALLTHSLIAVYLAHVAVQLLKTAMGYGLGYRLGLVRFRVDREAIRAVSRYALPVSVSAVFGVFVNYSDQLILSRTLPPGQFAFYAVGCLAVPPLTILEHSVARVLIPRLSEAFDRGRSRAASELYRFAVEELAFLLIPAVTGLVVFATPIILLLFTRTYLSAAGYLRVYALIYLTLILPYDSTARAKGQSGWILGCFSAFSLIALGLCLALGRAFGPFGALFGAILARFAMRGYSIFYIRRDNDWSLKDFLPLSSIALFAGMSALLGGLAVLVRPIFGSELSWFLGAGPVFTLAYFMGVLGSRRLMAGRPATRRVLMLTQHLGIGGLERMILNLASELQGAGRWTPSVFVFDHGRSSMAESNLIGEFEARGIEVSAFSKRAGFSLKSVLAITRYCLRREIELIHSHDLGALIYGVAAKWATLNRVRLVHTQHSFVHLDRNPRYRLYERFFTLFVDELSTVSEENRATYGRIGIAPETVAVVSNGVCFAGPPALSRRDRIESRRELLAATLAGLGESSGAGPRSSWREKARRAPSLADQVWVLYMARLHGRKGQDHAIRLWSLLGAGVRERLVLAFVGAETEKGELARIERLASQAPDADRLLYLGATHAPTRWLGAADLYLSCSEYEGLPLGPIEAVGSGLPAILSEIPGHALLRELSSQFPLESPALGARAIERCAGIIERGDPLEIETRWKNAEVVRERFSLGAMARGYQELYEGRAE